MGRVGIKLADIKIVERQAGLGLGNTTPEDRLTTKMFEKLTDEKGIIERCKEGDCKGRYIMKRSKKGIQENSGKLRMIKYISLYLL